MIPKHGKNKDMSAALRLTIYTWPFSNGMITKANNQCVCQEILFLNAYRRKCDEKTCLGFKQANA